MVSPNARVDGAWHVVKQHATYGDRLYSTFDTEADAQALAAWANATFARKEGDAPSVEHDWTYRAEHHSANDLPFNPPRTDLPPNPEPEPPPAGFEEFEV